MGVLLVPFDGRPAACAALRSACRDAGRDGAAVVALYVVRIPRQLPLTADLPWLAREVTPVQLAAQRIGEETGVLVAADWVCARDVVPVILDVAEELRAAGIVLGVTRSPHWWRWLPPWSVPARLLRRAPCPIIIHAAAPPGPPSRRSVAGVPLG